MSNLFIPYIGMDKVVSQEVSASLSGYQSQLNELSAAVDQMTILSGYDDTRIKQLIKNEEIGRIAIDNEISAKLINQINARISSDNIVNTSIQQLSQRISENAINTYTKLETNNLLSTKVNVSDFNDYKEQISSELSSIVDNDTIYDDTQIKADISELSSKLQNLVDNDTIYNDTQIKADISELSSKLDNLVDNDTIYDDTEIKADIVELSSKLENLVDNDTIYDDTEIRNEISELSSKLDNLEITGEIYDDTQIKADIVELSSKLDNLVDNDTIYDDTQLRNLISTETDARILEDASLSSQIEILSLEKGDDYTAFEVFPHNFYFANPGDPGNGVIKTVGEVFAAWQKVNTANIDTTLVSRNVGSLNILYKQNQAYKRFHPTSGYIDVTVQEVESLPEIGQISLSYKIGTSYYLYYDEAIRNLRNCLTTAKDDDIFFGMDSSNTLIINLRTKLTLQEVNSDKSDVLIDWGDGTQTKFKDYTASGSWYDFKHEYTGDYVNKNSIVKIFGKDYYFINFTATTTSYKNNKIVIITRMFDYDLPIASHLNIFANICASNLIYRIDVSKCKRSFEGCNIASMFRTHHIQQIRGFSDNSKEFAFNSIYCMNFMFNDVKHIKTIDFKFPALCKLPIFQYVFNNVYFNYGSAPYDILNLFNNFSFSLMPENEPVDVAGMFNNCKNITCSNYQKLGNYLWNNPKVNWTNTSGVFKGCPDDLRANIPVEWGGTLTGWTAPVKLTQEYVDNKDNLLINNISELSSKLDNLVDNDTIYDDTEIKADIVELSSKLYSLVDNDTVYDDTAIRNEISELQEAINDLQISGEIYDDTGIVQQISTISSKIQEISSIIKTDGFGNKFLADDGNYYQIPFNETNDLNTDKLSTYLDENGYLQVVPAEFITEAQLEQKNYIDEAQLNNKINTFDYINAQYLIDNEYLTIPELPNTAFIKTLVNRITKLQDTVIDLQNKLALTQLQLSEYKIEADEEIIYVTDYGTVSGYLPTDEQLSGIISGQI